MNAGELTEVAESWLLREYPDSIIVRELSVADWGKASVDIAAITPDKIVGVEVKGERDSPARLPLQGATYSRVCEDMWLLADASLKERCEKALPPQWAMLQVIRGRAQPVRTRNGCRAQPSMTLCPGILLECLWAAELRNIVKQNRLPEYTPTLRQVPAARAVLKHLPLPDIHAAVLGALRDRTWQKPVLFGPEFRGERQFRIGKVKGPWQNVSCLPSHGQFVAANARTCKNAFNVSADEIRADTYLAATHWMPLPEPPGSDTMNHSEIPNSSS